jgi:DNA-binding response OmpR family regulator
MSDKTILIIEDDPVIRLGLHVSLRANHYKTFLADDAIASIAEARKHNPDLIILDLGLPAGDGFVVMDRLKQFPSLSVIPVIVVSGRDPRVAERRALESGASAFLQKPVDNQVLLSTIRRLLPKEQPAENWYKDAVNA